MSSFDLSNIFGIDEFGKIESKLSHKNSGKSIDLIDFPCVHREDLEPVSLIFPDLEKGPWIAGGAVLRWYQNQQVAENDIDVFCSSPEQAQELIETIKSYNRYSVRFESENADTIVYSSDKKTAHWTIQVIKRRYFTTVQDVIDNFDITVCQVATAGNEYVLGTNTAKDIREHNLRMNYPLQPDAAKRMIKYWTYGFRPVDGLFNAVLENPCAKQIFAMDEDYQNAF